MSPPVAYPRPYINGSRNDLSSPISGLISPSSPKRPRLDDSTPARSTPLATVVRGLPPISSLSSPLDRGITSSNNTTSERRGAGGGYSDREAGYNSNATGSLPSSSSYSSSFSLYHDRPPSSGGPSAASTAPRLPNGGQRQLSSSSSNAHDSLLPGLSASSSSASYLRRSPFFGSPLSTTTATTKSHSTNSVLDHMAPPSRPSWSLSSNNDDSGHRTPRRRSSLLSFDEWDGNGGPASSLPLSADSYLFSHGTSPRSTPPPHHTPPPSSSRLIADTRKPPSDGFMYGRSPPPADYDYDYSYTRHSPRATGGVIDDDGRLRGDDIGDLDDDSRPDWFYNGGGPSTDW